MDMLYKPRKKMTNKHVKEDLEWECSIEEFIIENENIITAYVDKMVKKCLLPIEQDIKEARTNIIKNLEVAFRYRQFRHAEQREICRLYDEKYRAETIPYFCNMKKLVYLDNIFEPLAHEEIANFIKPKVKWRATNEQRTIENL